MVPINVCEEQLFVIKPDNYILFNPNSVVFCLHDQFFPKLLLTEILFPVMGQFYEIKFDYLVCITKNSEYVTAAYAYTLVTRQQCFIYKLTHGNTARGLHIKHRKKI